jgi:hypothetical protein
MSKVLGHFLHLTTVLTALGVQVPDFNIREGNGSQWFLHMRNSEVAKQSGVGKTTLIKHMFNIDKPQVCDF